MGCVQITVHCTLCLLLAELHLGITQPNWCHWPSVSRLLQCHHLFTQTFSPLATQFYHADAIAAGNVNGQQYSQILKFSLIQKDFFYKFMSLADTATNVQLQKYVKSMLPEQCLWWHTYEAMGGSWCCQTRLFCCKTNTVHSAVWNA